jgi:hypothetical protein
MGRTYTANWRSLRGANNGAEFEPGTCKSTRRGAKFIFKTLKMQAHVRNDVKQSVGLVVTSEWLE